MTFLYNQDGNYAVEGFSVNDLADKYGTPYYCYSSGALTAAYNDYCQAFAKFKNRFRLCYSIKSNSNQAVIATLAALGSGADCVSEGEIRRALSAGVKSENIVFAGVGKTDAELAFALDKDIFMFNVESEDELRRLNAVATAKNTKARVAFRVNPDIDAGTHHKISTGRKCDKFGIAYDDAERIYKEAAAMEGIAPHGIDMHIGSQLTSLAPFKAAFTRLADLVKKLRSGGLTISHLDIGGGLGINYSEQDNPPSIQEYADLVIEILGDLDCTLAIEPGRSIAANAGVLVSTVIGHKKAGDRNFLIIDAAMNDLIRPSLYDAYHEILPAVKKEDREIYPQDVVGPICETGDTFATKRDLQDVKPGERIVICSAGAYGAVMASNYNTRPFPPELLVSDNNVAVVRPRQNYEDVIGRDVVPDWIKG